MTIPGTGATQIDKLEINTINPGETLTIKIMVIHKLYIDKTVVN